MKDFDLDVDSPDEVANVLRDAADAYHESASELDASWQDKSAGRPWTIIARILEKAADQIDKAL